MHRFTLMTDLSSLGNNLAPNGITGPTYNTTGLGGKPALVSISTLELRKI